MPFDLASHFPEAQYFLCYAPLDFFGWVRVFDGKLTRAFAIGDEGIIWNKGRPTREEKGLGLRFSEIRTPKGNYSFAVNALNRQESDLSECASGRWGEWVEETRGYPRRGE